jgi:hypothetical protein
MYVTPPPQPSGMHLAPSTLASWIGAIATSAAVVVALFKDEWLRYIRRPRLRVRMKSEPPDCILIPQAIVSDNHGNPLWVGKMYWLRLWVENVGTGRAEQTQVFVARLFKKDANGGFSPITAFQPMNLRWANSIDLDRPEIFAPGISHGFGKHCDVCSISDPANPTDHQGYQGQCVGALQLEVVPGGDVHRLPPGNYVLRLRVGSANAAPVTAYVQINIKGPWYPDPEVMFRDYLGIRILPPAEAAKKGLARDD